MERPRVTIPSRGQVGQGSEVGSVGPIFTNETFCLGGMCRRKSEIAGGHSQRWSMRLETTKVMATVDTIDEGVRNALAISSKIG